MAPVIRTLKRALTNNKDLSSIFCLNNNRCKKQCQRCLDLYHQWKLPYRASIQSEINAMDGNVILLPANINNVPRD